MSLGLALGNLIVAERRKSKDVRVERNGWVVESKGFLSCRPASCDLDLAVGHGQRQTGVPILQWE